MSATVVSPHISPMTLPGFSSVLDPNPRRRERHRLTWFLTDGTVDFVLECLHEPVNRPHLCDGEFFLDEKGIFPECFRDGKTPVHDGVIESWWTGQEEDAEPWWQYAAEDTTGA